MIALHAWQLVGLMTASALIGLLVGAWLVLWNNGAEVRENDDA